MTSLCQNSCHRGSSKMVVEGSQNIIKETQIKAPTVFGDSNLCPPDYEFQFLIFRIL